MDSFFYVMSVNCIFLIDANNIKTFIIFDLSLNLKFIVIMKKTIYPFIAIAILGCLLSSCAKEKNKLDKILTDGTWTTTSNKYFNEQIVNEDQNGPGAVDRKTTVRRDYSVIGSALTDIYYNEEALSPGATTFDENTYTAETTHKYIFNEDGTYSHDVVFLFKTASSRDETGSLGSYNFSDPAGGYGNQGYWAWANTTDSKTQLTLDGDVYDVTLEKDKVIMSTSKTTENVVNNTVGGYLTTTTTTNTEREEIIGSK